MGITSATFPPALCTREDEYMLARCIEAGVYAAHLLAEGGSSRTDELLRVTRAGERAWERLWLSNLRLVAQLSHVASRRHRLPLDDLFQDGCLGLAEALTRFDFALGWRFSTLAHEYIQRALKASAARRAGELEGPGRRHRLRILLKEHDSLISSVEHRHPPVREMAQTLGVSTAAAAGAWAVTSSLDDIGPHQLMIDGGFDAVEVNGVDFLALLADAGELLRLRYGIGGRCHTQAEVAVRFGVSASTIARMERRALARARDLLESDQCRLPAPECHDTRDGA